MANAFKCDRCGTFSEGNPELRLNFTGRSMNAPYPSSPGLCIDCRDSFVHWWKDER